MWRGSDLQGRFKDHQVGMLCKTDSDVRRYYRFQVELSEGSDDMDDATPTNLRVLRLLAERLVTDRGSDITALCKQLQELAPPSVASDYGVA